MCVKCCLKEEMFLYYKNTQKESCLLLSNVSVVRNTSKLSHIQQLFIITAEFERKFYTRVQRVIKSQHEDSNISNQLFIKPSLEQNIIWKTNRSSPSVVERAVKEIIVGIQIQA